MRPPLSTSSVATSLASTAEWRKSLSSTSLASRSRLVTIEVVLDLASTAGWRTLGIDSIVGEHLLDLPHEGGVASLARGSSVGSALSG